MLKPAVIASQNQVNKYPTLKLYRHGVAVKKEYRGARAVEPFVQFIREQLASALKVVRSSPEFKVGLSEFKKRVIMGFFADQESENYKTFAKLASILRDSCNFIAGVG